METSSGGGRGDSQTEYFTYVRVIEVEFRKGVHSFVYCYDDILGPSPRERGIDD